MTIAVTKGGEIALAALTIIFGSAGYQDKFNPSVSALSGWPRPASRLACHPGLTHSDVARARVGARAPFLVFAWRQTRRGWSTAIRTAVALIPLLSVTLGNRSRPASAYVPWYSMPAVFSCQDRATRHSSPGSACRRSIPICCGGCEPARSLAVPAAGLSPHHPVSDRRARSRGLRGHGRWHGSTGARAGRCDAAREATVDRGRP